MAGFSLHPLLQGLKVRVTAIHQHDDRLYVGTASGALQIYSYILPSEQSGNDSAHLPEVKLLKTHTLGKRAIDQIGVLGHTSQLVVLSDMVVTLYSLPDLGKNSTTTLSQARSAHAFAITSYTAKSKKGKDEAKSGEKVRDLLVVGCRKKVVVFGAGKNGIKEGWELSLPHSPRHIIFPASSSASTSSTPGPLPETLHLLFTTQTSVILHINPSSAANRLSVSDLTTDPHPTARYAKTLSGAETTAGSLSVGVGALSGLGGYVGLGGKTAVPVGTRTVGGEVLLARDDVGVFYSSEGNYTRPESLQWPGPPDGITFANPYIYSVVPVVPASGSAGTSAISVSTVQIHLAPTLTLRQTLTLAAPSAGGLTTSSLVSTSTPGASNTPAAAMAAATKLLFISTPTDKTLLANEGSSIWALAAGDVGDEVDELVRQGRVGDAIGLVEAVGENGLSPSRRIPHLRTLQAVTQIASGEYQKAFDTFLVFNVNPALVLSLFPADTISGKLHVPKDQWMELFGAVEGSKLEPNGKDHDENDVGTAKSLLRSVAGLGGLNKRGSMETLRSAAQKDDTASIKSVKSSEVDRPPPAMNGEEVVPPRAALEELIRFLSDRRQKLAGAMSSTALPPESSRPPLSSLSAEELHALPSVPFTELDAEQLLRMAQIIYTGLIKVYLVARPVLVGSLCRIENWCDVEEVEELLKAQKKFGDLIDLYQGKKMHAKALKMLHELAKEEEDRLDRYPPTVRYLQKLGPSELSLILESSKWIFQEDPKMALQIFVADEAEVEALPRNEVMTFLEKTDQDSCVGYLEHIIDDLGEDGSDYHDKLAELRLMKVNEAKKGKKGTSEEDEYRRLLDFLTKSTRYRPHRLISKLPDELPEARAVVLGRMGKHEDALRIYVYSLEDYTAAEAYCVRSYPSEPEIFLLLLRLYLQPLTPNKNDKSHSQSPLLEPALSLISKHSTSLPPSPVLDLLPPLVSMQEVHRFFLGTLREGHRRQIESAVIKGLAKSRKEEVERVLMGLEVKRVRVTDQRICPQCHKRLGQSAIAVHAPRGEVTHLHCKDPFSAALAKERG